MRVFLIYPRITDDYFVSEIRGPWDAATPRGCDRVEMNLPVE